MTEGRRCTTTAFAFLVGTAVGVATVVGRAGQPPSSTSGKPLFTEAQATAGKAIFDKTCAACHGATLTGGTAPPLTGAALQASWRNPRVTLDDIFFVSRTTMPPRASGSLTPQEHASVFM